MGEKLTEEELLRMKLLEESLNPKVGDEEDNGDIFFE